MDAPTTQTLFLLALLFPPSVSTYIVTLHPLAGWPSRRNSTSSQVVAPLERGPRWTRSRPLASPAHTRLLACLAR